MTLQRGDVCLARFPHAAGVRGKRRPVVVVQDDGYNQRFPHVVAAEVTSNLANQGDPAFLFIDVNTPEGLATGLTRNSLVSCLHLALMYQDRADQVIGKLSDSLLQQLDSCLKAALSLP